MSFDEFFWDIFQKSGSVDAYLGYMDCKKIEEKSECEREQ
jgi:hypothetical protein